MSFINFYIKKVYAYINIKKPKQKLAPNYGGHFFNVNNFIFIDYKVINSTEKDYGTRRELLQKNL